MSEERLKEIKDSIDFQALYIKEHKLETTLLDEEIDLYNEVIKLQARIDKAIEITNKIIDAGYDTNEVLTLAIKQLDVLQGVDKE